MHYGTSSIPISLARPLFCASNLTENPEYRDAMEAGADELRKWGFWSAGCSFPLAVAGLGCSVIKRKKETDSGRVSGSKE